MTDKNKFLFLESKESSSPIITRSVANGLLGKNTDIYSFSPFEKAALRMIGILPSPISEFLIPRVNSTDAIDGEQLKDLKISTLVNQRLDDYKDNSSKYPAIVMGVGMGGATSHISLELKAPFLPQAFVLTLKGGTKTGNINEYIARSHYISQNISKQDTKITCIHHYDPIHDGWLVKHVNHLRLKLISLPDEYKSFILSKLEPGGEIIYLEGKALWKRAKLDERIFLQVGGWGDISDHDFLEGSEEIAAFSKKEKLKYSSWKISGYPFEDGPESEWGSEPGLSEAIEAFCVENGFKFSKISFKDPNDFSRLAFYGRKLQLEKNEIEPLGTVVEVFSQYDANIINNSALLPLWLIFNTRDSLKFLDTMLQEFPKSKPVFLSTLSTFSRTPDLVPWKSWFDLFSDFPVINIGTRQNHYPGDPITLLDWKSKLQNWASTNKIQPLPPLNGDDLKSIATKILSTH